MNPPPDPGADQGHSTIASSAVLLGLGNVASRLLGLFREQVIAALFGATGPTSAFRTSTRLSTAVYDLLLAGATTSALVPVFSDYLTSGRREDLSRIVSTFINLTIIGLGGVVLVLMAYAAPLVSLLGADDEHFSLTVDLTRIALPSIVLLGVSGILSAVLYAQKSFRVPAFAGAAFNAGIIVAALSLSGLLSIYALPLGLTAGALAQVALQIPAIRSLGYLPVIDLKHPGVRLVFRLYLPVFLGMLTSYALVMIDTRLAWGTGQDSVAAMAFATTLIQLPIGLVGVAASLAILPSLSALASSAESTARERFITTLISGLRAVLILILPISITMVLLREPIVALLFQRLAFDHQAVERTSVALLAYSPQLPFVVIDQLLIVAYYAQKRTITPVVVGVVGVGIYLAVALSTVGSLGMPGLALANAVQNSAHAIILYALLARHEPTMRSPGIIGFATRLMVAASVSTAVGWWLAGAWSAISPATSAGPQLVQITAVGVATVASYFVALRLLGVEESRRLRSWLTRRSQLPTDP